MFAYGALRWFACVPLVLAATSEPALAWQGTDAFSATAKPSSSAVMVTGRKGTRNYAPDDDTTLAKDKEDTAQSEEDPKARLDQCMASWDKGTHLSQSSWRQICNREIKANE